jgi:hypothetical protein
VPVSAEDPALAGFPQVRLAHFDRSERGRDIDEIEDYYTLYPIAVPRPEAGRITTRVICGSCGMSVRCTVCSLAERRRVRRRRVAAGCALLEAVLLLDCCTGLFVSGHRAPAMAGWNDLASALIGSVSVCLLVPVAVLLTLRLSLKEGVFVSRKGGHSIRPPGSTVSTRHFKEPNF